MPTPPRNQIECLAFTEEAFCELVRKASSSPADASPNPQTKYLGRYLSDIGAKTIIVEGHYIDRHFIEEVGIYYSRCLNQPSNFCVRAHFFSDPIASAQLDKLIERMASGKLRDVREELQRSYLGFVVVRPIASVPIARTVLLPFRDDPGRKFPTCIDYPVHFLGIELQVHGLAFQQQDRAVAACATTALWTALQRVCRHDGARAPTPSAITEAAVRHFLAQGRPFPSPGLTIEQICEALRGFEFAPELFKVGASPQRFRLLLQAYVRSGIPVILGLRGEGEDIGHAVTVVGYREAPSADVSFKVDGIQFDVSNLGFEKIYIHDDRYGPYARARLVEKPKYVKKGKKATASSEAGLNIVIDNLNEEWKVEVAVVPLYPKLRTTAAELFTSATDLIPLVESEFAANAERVGIEMFFDRSGSYLASLNTLGIDPTRAVAFFRTIALSRYVGIVRWRIGGQPLMDSLWDTTDRLRQTQYGDQLLGIVAFNPKCYTKLDDLANELNILSG